ncbi:MAG: hypothetical protein JWR70_996 [Modestobacter sp.]|nr:hypothetical protein [Modestobacter sp.]
MTAVKKIVLWLMSTLTVLVLLFGYHTSTSSTASASGESSVVVPVPSGTGTTSSDTSSATGTTSAPSANSTSSSSGTSPSTSSSAGRAATSTTVTGDSASTRWGPVQVRLAVRNGTITDVSVVEYPSSNGKDKQINARALPILVQETLKAQNAQIDMVSGATVTSDGYLKSLQSALDKAGL